MIKSMKVCCHCLKQFDPTPHQLKKCHYVCVECNRKYQTDWRKRRIAEGKPVRGKTPSKEWWDNYFKNYYLKPEVKKRRNALMKKYREDPRQRIKHIARWVTHHAILAGKLTRGVCAICSNPVTEAHHLDYHKPLLILWLCRSCHRKEHRKAEGREL